MSIAILFIKHVSVKSMEDRHINWLVYVYQDIFDVYLCFVSMGCLKLVLRSHQTQQRSCRCETFLLPRWQKREEKGNTFLIMLNI